MSLPPLRSVFRKMILVSLLAPAAAVDACGSRETEDPAADAGGDSTPGDDESLSELRDAIAEDADAHPDPCAPVPYTGTDDAGTCTELAYYPCGLPSGVVSRGNCYFSPTDCRTLCPGFSFNCHTWDDSCFDGAIPESGPVTVDCVKCPNAAGRRPPGLSSPRATPHSSALGAYFARAAYLESASVHAFQRLHADLAFYGAPRTLLARALSAKDDEVRHSAFTARMATRFGDKAMMPRVTPTCHRDLEAIAIENMVEGCIRESFGALVALWQGAHSKDREIAFELARLADDEAAHAELSWDVARWLNGRLSPAARERVRQCAEAALDGLECEISSEHDFAQGQAALERVTGLPSPGARASLFSQFQRFARQTLVSEALAA